MSAQACAWCSGGGAVCIGSVFSRNGFFDPSTLQIERGNRHAAGRAGGKPQAPAGNTSVTRRSLRVTLVFLGLSCAFGGGIFAIGLLGGRGLTLRNGILYSAMDLKIILLSAAVCYVALTLVFSRTAKHSRRELIPAVLSLGEKRVALTALVDTGNTLADPVTGRPVMVAEGAKLGPLLPEEVGELALKDPVGTMERLSKSETGKRFRLLPYQAVGVECGMLLALRLDRAQVGTVDYGGILVALSPNQLSDGGGYSALIGTRE